MENVGNDDMLREKAGGVQRKRKDGSAENSPVAMKILLVTRFIGRCFSTEKERREYGSEKRRKLFWKISECSP